MFEIDLIRSRRDKFSNETTQQSPGVLALVRSYRHGWTPTEQSLVSDEAVEDDSKANYEWSVKGEKSGCSQELVMKRLSNGRKRK